MTSPPRAWMFDLGPIITRIEAAQTAVQRPVLVAIDGQSGTGKSTLARAISAKRNVTIIEGDDFYAGGIALRSETNKDLAKICIDWRRQRDVLQDLLIGRPTSFAPFDWVAFDGSLAPRKTLLPSKVLILEGVYSARPELRDLLDLTICLTLPDPERLRRLTAREGEISAWEAQWHRAENWYFAQAPLKFDLVLTTGDGM